MCIVYKRHFFDLLIVSRGTLMKKFTSNSQKIGELGEEVACKYLINKGFSIVERNYTKKWGEIDIIANKDNKIYFVEVKSKSVNVLPEIGKDGVTYETKGYRPEENMHPWKLKRLSRTVGTYLISKRVGNTLWQFDLLTVFLDLDNRKARVQRLENIVL